MSRRFFKHPKLVQGIARLSQMLETLSELLLGFSSLGYNWHADSRVGSHQ